MSAVRTLLSSPLRGISSLPFSKGLTCGLYKLVDLLLSTNSFQFLLDRLECIFE